MALYDLPLTPAIGNVLPLFRAKGLHSSLVDYEPGGVALNDTSAGLWLKPWKLRGVQVGANWEARISAEGHAESVLFSRAGIVQEVGLAFTQNMSPVVVFTDDAGSFIWWYDASLPGGGADYVFTEVVGGRQLRCTFNRDNMFNVPESDVIVTYLNGDDDYCARYQREEYAVENVLLSPPAGTRNVSVYISKGGRLVYKLL